MIDINVSNEKNLAIERALTITSFVESIESIINNLNAFCVQIPYEKQPELKVYISQLEAIFAALDNNGTDLAQTLSEAQSIKSQFPTAIKRMNCADMIIKLKQEQGLTNKEIAAKCGVSARSVGIFLETYEGLSVTEKVKTRRTDAFDFYENIQNLWAGLSRQIARFEQDGDASPKFYGEARQLLGFCHKFIEAYDNRRRFDELVSIIREELILSDPERREYLTERFKVLDVTGFMPVNSTHTQTKKVLDATI